MSQPTLAAARRRPPPVRPPLSLASAWHDAGVRAWIYQIVVVAGVIGLGAFLIGNAQDALSKQGISTGFSFLWQTAGFDIGETIVPFSSQDSFLKAYGVAVLNTLKVAAAGIALSTVIGVIVGVGRLSQNLLVRKLASIYVEVFRNTPQLLQLIFWYTLITSLPRPRDALSVGGAAFLSNRGLSMPWFGADFPVFASLAALIAGCAAGWGLLCLSDARRRRMAQFGAAALALGAPLAVILASGASLQISVPRLAGFNFRDGTTISPEFLALLLGLSLYIAAFIAEIVRSGIQSVSRGQVEAAASIGLSRFHTYRKVIFPQALRVMVPPAAGQFVSVVKNSSLGVAVGYPELFSINNTIVTLSGHTVEAIAIMMSIYLGISFVIAMAMNLYNRFVQIRER
ncbi:ABC transporter permease subunit [Terrihabitans rhizophilus]|uniref:ABC transporter permease subunit n=1 Tax=Terrihabitans rhizophilus TaxID=3092662 RepID=A0ABU4RM20_9HYPH|nr:ABC transporter permease subunit [Terrihabitans sp. PJ23]MDX6804720.1 ABC transporter permease subunit [Terrihabitans sp. PJ23]